MSTSTAENAQNGPQGAAGEPHGTPTAPEAGQAPTQATTPPADRPAETADDGTDWKAKARQWEDRAKENKEAAKQVGPLTTQVSELTARAETAEADAATWRGKYQGLLKESAILDAATTAGALSPRAVLALAKENVDVDDDGEVTGVEAAIKAVQNAEPSLFNTRPPAVRDATAGGNGPLALNSDGLTKALAGAVGARV